jgi:hypothetical protein
MQFNINEETSSEEVLKVIKELELLAKAKKENEEASKFPVKLGEVYYAVAACGNVLNYQNSFDSFDMSLLDMGNVYATKEEALMQVETLQVIQELKQCKGYQPFKVDSDNYSLYYDFGGYGLGTSNMQMTIGIGFAGVFFNSKDNAINAITKVGEQRIINAMLWYYCKQVNL